MKPQCIDNALWERIQTFHGPSGTSFTGRGDGRKARLLSAVRLACNIVKASRQSPHSVDCIGIVNDDPGSLNSSTTTASKIIDVSKERSGNDVYGTFSAITISETASTRLENTGSRGIGEIPETSFGNINTNQESGMDTNQTNILSDIGAVLYRLFSGSPPPIKHPTSNANGSTSQLNFAVERDHAQKRGRQMQSDQVYTPLRELGLPVNICSIISDLINPREGGRYCTPAELEEDLSLMFSKPDKFLFEPDTKSPWDKLDFPRNKMYGREEQISRLRQICERAKNQGGAREIVMVSGYSGSGKSSLVANIGEFLVHNGDFFLSGKFDEMKNTQTLFKVANAFNEFCDLLLKRSVKIQEEMKMSIMTALGTDIEVLMHVIPNLSKVVGEVNATPIRVQGKEAYNRLKFLFGKFVGAISKHSCLIALFLDDLQWADNESLELMHHLVVNADTASFLFLGSYRDNAIGPDHQLALKLQHLSEMDVVINDIKLGNIDEASLNEMISDTLHLVPRATQLLASVVYCKTGGNALFATQFLHSLQDEGLLRYSFKFRGWEWDVDTIQSKAISDGVVDLMTKKMLKLPQNVQEVLKAAACFGFQCDESILKLLEGNSSGKYSDLVKSLDVVVNEGFMIRVKNLYRFSHDQIQHAAFSLMSSHEQEATHLHLGRLVLEKMHEVDEKDMVFVVAQQLNYASNLIVDHKEKIKLARLNLIAGGRAMEASAFVAASLFLFHGTKMLEESDWESHYELSLQLFNCYTEALYVTADFSKVYLGIDSILKHAKYQQDKFQAYIFLAKSLFAQNKVTEVVELAITVLRMLGEVFPEEINHALTYGEFIATKDLLEGFTIDGILQSEEMIDPDKISTMKFLDLMIPSLYCSTKQEVIPVFVFRMVQLTLRHGMCKESASAFAAYGMILCSKFDDFEDGYRFGKVAISLLERFKAEDLFARVNCLVYVCINSYFEPLQACLEQHLKGYEVGLATGDIEFAFLNTICFILMSIQCGQNLVILLKKLMVYVQQLKSFKQNSLLQPHLLYVQVISNLIDSSGDPTELSGEAMNQSNWFQTAQEAKNGSAVSNFYFFRMWLAFLFRKYELAGKMAEDHASVSGERVRSGTIVNEVFYKGLVAITLARIKEEDKWKELAKTALDTLHYWAQKSSWNCLHKLELLYAEWHSFHGDIEKATTAFDRSIHRSGKNGFIHEQALACERASIFCIRIGNAITAAEYLTRACELYLQWGARRKADDVLEQLREIELTEHKS